MLYLLPIPSPDLPAGTRSRVISTRDDLHFDSAGMPCHVLQSPDELDLEKLPEEQLPALGFKDFDEADKYSQPNKNGEEIWEIAVDKEAAVQAEIAAILERAYPGQTEKILSAKLAVMQAVSAPVGVVKRVGG